MLNKKTCVPCKGGIPPLTAKEITPFLKELSSGWQPIENKQIENSQHSSASYIGIRPEDIKIDQNGSYDVKIETTELLGAETLISFKSDTINGILLTQENVNVGEGDNIKIGINESKILYFDNNEQRIR